MEYSAYNDLPITVFLNIIDFLDYSDIISCSQVCSNWRKYSFVESKWKNLCDKNLAIEKGPNDLTWRDLFLSKVRYIQKYKDLYPQISTAWRQIESYTAIHLPHIRESLYGGWQEKDLLEFESKNNIEIPLDLRCAYLFHGGQNYDAETNHNGPFLSEWPNSGWYLRNMHNSVADLHKNGLFGSVQNYDYFRTNIFLQPTIFEQMPSDVMVLTTCTFSSIQQYIAVRDFKNLKRGQIFSLPNFKTLTNDSDQFFIIADSFLEYFTDYAAKLSSDYFPIERGHIYRFYKEPSCEAVTNHVKVEVATSFMPEMSSITPPRYTYAYRVKISMDKNVDAMHRCQLINRHWKIEDGDGNVERVDGPGVIGLHPTIEPGTIFTYISCTNFRTQTGKMYGTFGCTRPDKSKIHITVPEFNMTAFPFICN